MRVHADPAMLSATDLIIARLRDTLQLSFDSAENTPPSLLNFAELFGGNRVERFFFTTREPNYGAFAHRIPGINIYSDSLPNQQWTLVEDAIDAAWHKFVADGSPASHISRLIFQFEFKESIHVLNDIRREFLAPIIDSFPGKLTYPAPEDYPIVPEVNEFSPHPSGIAIAWEGEYRFSEGVAIPTLDHLLQSAFGKELILGWPTQLPEREVEGCRFRVCAKPRFF